MADEPKSRAGHRRIGRHNGVDPDDESGEPAPPANGATPAAPLAGVGCRRARALHRRRGTDESIWAYTGSRDHDSAVLRQMSSIDHVTAAFPPTFISGGNADPLTDAQSRPLAVKLSGAGVKVTPLFYPPDHEPDVAHEYQFDLDNADGKNALAQMLSFLKQYTAS